MTNKILSLLLVVCMLFVLLPGCSEEDVTTEEVDTELLTGLYEECLNMVNSTENTKELAEYLYDWAKENQGLRVSHDSHNNVIVSKVASSEEYKNAESTILQCTMDLSAPSRTAMEIAAIVYIMENCENHGFIRALFTEPDKGIGKMKVAYLTADNVISLDYSKSNTIMTTAAARHDYEASKKISYVDASYPNAYEIEISGLERVQSHKTNQINAVKTLGKMIAELKSAGALIEIASFNSINDGDGYPLGAKVVLLVNDNDINKLTKKVTKNQSKTLEKYQEANPNMVYSFNKLEDNSVESVISADDTSTLISFIYTSLYGVYDKDDEGEPMSVNNILSCNTEEGSFDIHLVSYSLSEGQMDTLDGTIETLCGLYEIDYREKVISDLWQYHEDSELITKIRTAANKIYESEIQFNTGFENRSAALISEKVENANIVVFGVTEKNLERQIATLLTYFNNNLPEEE